MFFALEFKFSFHELTRFKQLLNTVTGTRWVGFYRMGPFVMGRGAFLWGFSHSSLFRTIVTFYLLRHVSHVASVPGTLSLCTCPPFRTPSVIVV